MERPVLWLLAGPNGVGKTRYARAHIRAVTGSTGFVNLDEIARGLSPIEPEAGRQAAARVALGLIRERLAAPARGNGRASFTIETTLAGRTHLRTVAAARAAGFAVNLLFFIVPEVATCIARVARRVAEGGHDVPEADIRRRYVRSIANFPDYAAAADFWRVFDNGRPAPVTAAEGRGSCVALRGAIAILPAPLGAAIAAMPDCPEA